ncbi:TPA: hypothetical protein ACH3X1_011569 [Trebouxia sp. C0004]
MWLQHSTRPERCCLGLVRATLKTLLPCRPAPRLPVPRVLTSSCSCQGGVGLVEVLHKSGSQAKVVSRLLELSAWHGRCSAAPPVDAHVPCAGIRRHHLFSTISIGCLQLQQAHRVCLAFRACDPIACSNQCHAAEDVLNEPIFYNRQVSVPWAAQLQAAPLTAQLQALTPMISPPVGNRYYQGGTFAGCFTAAAASSLHSLPQSVLMTMPHLAGNCYGSPDSSAWRQGLSASGSQLIQNTQTAVGSQTFVSGGMGLGTAACPPTDSAAGKPALAADPSQQHGILTPGALVCRPRFLPLPGSDQSSAQVLQELESRWTASMQASPASRARPSSDLLDPQPAWMAPSSGHRPHWAQRQQRQQTQQQQPARQPKRLPSDRAANDDTVDVLGVPVSHPQLSEWRKLWELASAAYFDRQHRILWRVALLLAVAPRPAPDHQPHVLECPVAATVVSWLCRLWQAMTGYMPVASVATILAASTQTGNVLQMRSFRLGTGSDWQYCIAFGRQPGSLPLPHMALLLLKPPLHSLVLTWQAD